MEPKLTILNALIASEPFDDHQLDELASSLVCLFECNNKSVRLLRWCVQNEVRKSGKIRWDGNGFIVLWCGKYIKSDLDMAEVYLPFLLLAKNIYNLTMCTPPHTLCNSVASYVSIFREDSLYTKILRVYFGLMGKGYLTAILQPTIKKMSQSKKSYEVCYP